MGQRYFIELDKKRRRAGSAEEEAQANPIVLRSEALDKSLEGDEERRGCRRRTEPKATPETT